MLSIDKIRALADPDPELKPILEAGNAPVGWTLDTDIAAMRSAIAKMRQEQQKPDPSTLPHIEEDIKIPLEDGLQTDARVYTPREMPADGCPGMVVFHGGGYMVGDLETEAWLCELFTKLGGIAVNVDYRHAPEHPFPAAVNDAVVATKWTAMNAESLGINPAKGFIIGGESSGADMALVVAHICQESKMRPQLTGIYAPIPGGARKEVIPEKYQSRFLSMEQCPHAPMLCTESLELIEKNYKPSSSSPMFLPIAFPNHGGLPKTYFQVCGLDPTRDCGLIMELVFKDAAVQTKMDVYPGLPHAFWALFPDFEATKRHEKESEEGLKWLLS